MTSGRSFAVVLFTDIVGSTERAAELGDHGWRELLAEHHALVRREIKRYGGREANTAGDGFLATFTSPAPAIRCAWAIRESLRELGLEVRSGIHAAEIEGRGRDLGGIGVHIGARVAGQAGPGEVLVTSAVREVVTGAGFRFEDAGVHALKGVPGQWRLYRLKGLPAGLPGRTGRWVPELTTRHAMLGGAAVLAVLVMIAGAMLLRRADAPSLTPEEALAADAAPGVAVLPFATSGPGLEIWREGVIDLVSTNIDGAAGLRAIDSRTVLARWRERVPDGATADLPTALDVARRTGARYALLGNAAALGSEVRLTADLYDARTGRNLGTAQAHGAPDSVYALIDQLSIRVLETILSGEVEDIPQVDLARVTTQSLAALKAYLEGETLFRRSEFEAAIPAYQRAVEADSTFALALFRLSTMHGWSESIRSDLVFEYSERAARFADRLPEREAVLVRANLALERGTLDGLEPLRRAVRKYPDDAELWYFLGDTYYHVGPFALVDDVQAERAFDRAIAIDPSFSPAHIHPIEYAFWHADSARARSLIARYDRLAGGSRFALRVRLAYDLAWGGPEGSERGRAALDTTQTRDVSAVGFYLLNPRFLRTSRSVLEEARQRDDATHGSALYLLFARLLSGQIDAIVASIDDPLLGGLPVAYLYGMHDLGWSVPVARLDEMLAATEADTAPGTKLLFAAAWAAESGRWPEYDRFVGRARSDARQLLAQGDSTRSRYIRGLVQAMEAYAAWRRGDRERALALLETARVEATSHDFETGILIRGWYARLLAESGRHRDAVQAYRSVIGDETSLVALELGREYEQLGDFPAARHQYELFLTAMRDADPALAPQIAQARQAIARLGFSPRG